MQIDKTLPFPYLPDYTGTYQDRQKAFKQRLALLKFSLELLKDKLKQDNNDLSLLAELEKCNAIVNDMFDISNKLA